MELDFYVKLKIKIILSEANTLITANHVLNEIDLSAGKEIHLLFNNINNVKIKMHKLRKFYTNKDDDITIIEIKSNDNFDENYMLEIDENIFQQNIKEIFNKKQIYLLHIPKGTEIRYSTEYIRNIDDYGTINHFSDTDNGSSGAPIINFETRKVIGVHYGYTNSFQGKPINLGKILTNSIEEFYKIKNNENNKNEIILIIEVKKEDLNKNIYFLDNLDYNDDIFPEKKQENNSLIELNESNIHVYGDNEKQEHFRYFNPKKEGI